MPLPVNTYMLFQHLEVACRVVQLLKTQKGTFKNVQILREGDVGNIAEANWDVLDIYHCTEASGTEVNGAIFRLVVESINQIIFPQSLKEALFINLLLLLGNEEELITINLFSRDGIPVDVVVAVNSIALRTIRLIGLLPILFPEVGE